MNRLDLISGIFWFSVSVFFIRKALELEVGAFSNPQPGFLLFWSSLFLGALSVVLVSKSFVNKTRITRLSAPWKGLNWSNVVIAVALLFLYASFLKSIGFIVAMFLFLACLYFIGKVKLHLSIFGAAVTVFLAYMIFHVALQVQLPKGILAW